jgi:hypothetical protein
VTLTLTGDTSGITTSIAIILPGSSASVTVATVGSDTLTDSMVAFESESSVGIHDVTVGFDVLDTDNPGFASYALNTPIGPLAGESTGDPGQAFQTAGGTLVLNGPFDVDHPSTFTATTAGTPEPGTLAMFGLGIGLFAFGRRKIQ